LPKRSIRATCDGSSAVKVSILSAVIVIAAGLLA
jgi:hypothetical protein